MTRFEQSYVGQLRTLVGNRLLLCPGARAGIDDSDSKILLELRSDFGVWGLPGGMAEPGESLQDVIEREILEETGLKIEGARPFGFGNDPERETVTYPNGDLAQHFVLNFHTSTFSGSLEPDNEETLELAWFDPAGLPEMPPNMRQSIVSYLEFKRTGEFQLF